MMASSKLPGGFRRSLARFRRSKSFLMAFNFRLRPGLPPRSNASASAYAFSSNNDKAAGINIKARGMMIYHWVSNITKFRMCIL